MSFILGMFALFLYFHIINLTSICDFVVHFNTKRSSEICTDSSLPVCECINQGHLEFRNKYETQRVFIILFAHETLCENGAYSTTTKTSGYAEVQRSPHLNCQSYSVV